MQRPRTACFARPQSVAQILIARRAFEKPFEQSAQVETCAARDDRQPPACRNARNRNPRNPCEFTRREQLVRVQNVDQVVRNSTPLTKRQFGGPDVKMAIHLQRIAVDDFAMEFFSNLKREVAFSGARRTTHCNQWQSPRVIVYSVSGVCGQTPLYNEKMFFGPTRGCRAAEKRVGS